MFAEPLPLIDSTPVLSLSATVPVSGAVRVSWTVALIGIPRIFIVSVTGGRFVVPLNEPEVRSADALIVPTGGIGTVRPSFLSLRLPPTSQLFSGMTRSPVSGVVLAPAGSASLMLHVLGAGW